MRAVRNRAARLLLGSVLLLVSADAEADGMSVRECIAANEKSGPLRHAGKLLDARAQLRLCSTSSCPTVVRADCAAGAAQLDAAVPSVLFAVQDAAGTDLTAVVVTMDGAALASKLDGHPLEIDPGEHSFRLEVEGEPPVERRLLIREGEKNRIERVRIGQPVAPVATAPAPPASPSSGRKTLGLVLGGAGVVGLGVGAVTGLMTFSAWGNAKNACGQSFPRSCNDSLQASNDRSTAVTTGTASTVAFVAGGLALGAGAVVFFTAPPEGSRSAVTVSFVPRFDSIGGGLQVRGVLP